MITQSPMGRSNPLVIAARHDKSHLDLATHFIRDSNALPDKSVYNPSGYLERSVQAMTPPPTTTCGRHSSIEPRRSSSLRPDTSSLATVSQLSQSRPPSAKNPATHWPPVFYADFTSRTWLTIAINFLRFGIRPFPFPHSIPISHPGKRQQTRYWHPLT